MRIKRSFLIAVLMTATFLTAMAQNSQVLYFMKLPQNQFMNPAFKPANKFYFGLPVITGIHAGIGNDFFTLSDVVPPGSKIDSSIFQNLDLDRLAVKLKDRNTIVTDFDIQLLGLGLSFGKDLYVFFDVRDRVSARIVLPHDLLDLYIKGYDQYIGHTLDLSGMNIKGQYFREYGLGFSKNITNNLRIGAKAKLLSGIASISLDNRSFTLKVNNDFSQSVTADASLDVSGKEAFQRIFNDNNFLIPPLDSTRNADIKGFALDYLKCPVLNRGVSFDFGFVYNLGKLVTFSASVTDLGLINWGKDYKSYNANSNFNMKGITLEDVVNKTYSIDDMVNSLVDSIKSNFIENPSPQPYKTYLPTSISAGVSLNPLPVLSIGLLSNSKLYNGTVKESFTVSANAYLGRILSASMSYTAANYSYNNLGFGLAFKAGIAQIYVIADKIPFDWEKVYIEKKKDSGNYFSFPVPQNMNLFSLEVGLNIVFGKPVKKVNDKPMVLVN
jgi:hypothetical protein